MFRRIELIEDAVHPSKDFKHGLCGLSLNPNGLLITDAWIDIPQVPKHLNKNCRFYFTEAGWKKFGSKTVEACKKAKQRFHIITIKEKSVDIFYIDKHQVAVRPKKKISIN